AKCPGDEPVLLLGGRRRGALGGPPPLALRAPLPRRHGHDAPFPLRAGYPRSACQRAARCGPALAEVDCAFPYSGAMALDLHFRSSSVEIKSTKEIDAMREVGRLAGDSLSKVADMIRPGVTTNELNAFVHEDTLKKGARPAPLNYRNGDS